ncbi:MAG: hypothetical protein KDC67_05200 [Ignavibacteriae bacterium]|nr:hypothetical protein [Ignavibacteriota bacterium]
MNNEITVYKRTNDNWYPSFELKSYYDNKCLLVLVSLIEINNPNISFKYKVSAWGNDDLGLEKYFSDKNYAYDMFFKVISLEYVDIGTLIDLGFIGA